jgi:hypothetical protein
MFDSISSYYKLRLQVGLIIVCAVVLLFSAYTTYAEIRYAFSGRTAAATLDGVEEVRSSRRDSQEKWLRVRYSFADADGSKRAEADDMPADWAVPGGTTVNVQFIAGMKDWSRIAGHDRLWLTLPFIICSTIVIVFLVQFYREFREHERRKASW